MFDIGFSELVLLSIVALVVLGPERLPGAIRTISLWVGRLRRSFNTIKNDIEKEIGADDIRRQLRNEAIMDKFKQTKSQVNDALNSVKKETDEFRKNIELEAQAAAFTSNGEPTKPAASKLAAEQSAAFAEPAPADEPASEPSPSATTASSTDTPSKTADS